MLTREDVERIIDNKIKEKDLLSISNLKAGLTIEIQNTDSMNPNDRIIVVSYNGTRITSGTFCVAMRSEYEGY